MNPGRVNSWAAAAVGEEQEAVVVLVEVPDGALDLDESFTCEMRYFFPRCSCKIIQGTIALTKVVPFPKDV